MRNFLSFFPSLIPESGLAKTMKQISVLQITEEPLEWMALAQQKTTCIKRHQIYDLSDAITSLVPRFSL